MKKGKTPNAQRQTSNLELPNGVDSAAEFAIGRWTLGVRRFLPAVLFRLRGATSGAYCAELMRLFLRRAALILATGSLVFFLSCERHHVGELAGDHKTENKASTEEHQPDSKADQPAATSHQSHTSPSPAPRNSPANFFPDKPKP